MLQNRFQNNTPIVRNAILDKALNPHTETIYASYDSSVCRRMCKYNAGDERKYETYGYAD